MPVRIDEMEGRWMLKILWMDHKMKVEVSRFRFRFGDLREIQKSTRQLLVLGEVERVNFRS